MSNLFGSKHLKALRDNYRPAFGVAILLLLSFIGQAQVFPIPSTGFGTRQPRAAIDSALYGPTGCGAPTDSTFLFSQGFGQGQKLRKYAQYYDTCGHHFYIWDPALKSWHIADSGSGGGSTDTASISNRINSKQTDLVEIPITYFGAKPDSATDATVAIQKVVDSIASRTSEKGVVVITPGVFFVAGTIHIPLGVQITFRGSGGSTGEISNAISKLVTNRTTGDVIIDSADNTTFTGFDIQNNAASPTAGAGIHMVGRFVKIEHMAISNFYYNIELENSLYNSVSYVSLLEAVQYSLYNSNNALPDWGDLSVDHCLFQSGTGPIQHATVAAFYQPNSGGVKLTHNKFNGSSSGIQTCIRADFVGSGNSTSDLIMDANSFEGFSKYAVWITCPGANFANVIFTNNEVAGFGSSTNALLYDGTTGGLHRGVIGHNTFNSVDTAIQAYHVDQLKISGNTIDSPSTVSYKFVTTFCTNCSFDDWDIAGAYTAIGSNTTTILDSVFNRLPRLTTATIRSYTPAYGNQHVYLQDPLANGFFAYDSTDNTTVDDSAMTFVTAGGARWKRIIPFNYISVKWFGAKGDGTTNDWYSIQKAINYVIAHPAVPRDVFFPQGNYTISAPLIVANFNGTTYSQATVNLVGIANAKNDPTSVISKITVNENQTFGIGFQQGKGCSVRNLMIQGEFSFPNTLNVTQVDTLTFAQWTDGVSRQNQHSPYAGIVFSPFSDSTRYASNSDMYPGLHSYCPAGMPASGNTDITISNCSITNFVVGICITPSFQQNDEIINVRDCNIGGNKVGYAICQAQSKDCHVSNFMSWVPIHTIFDNVSYGNGGANVFPDVSGGNIAAAAKQLINSNTANFRGSVENVYAENLFRIGYSNSRTGFLFKGCDFNFATDLGNTPLPDFFILGDGNRFEDCQLRMYGAMNSRLFLNQTDNVYEGGGTNAPPVITNLDNGITNHNPSFRDVTMYYSTGVLGGSNISNSTFNPFSAALGTTLGNQPTPVYPSKYEYVPNAGLLMRYKIEYSGSYDRQISLGSVTLHTTRSTWSGYFIPAATADTAVLAVGDFLAGEDIHYQDQFTGSLAATYPIGYVSAVSGDTVYFQNLAIGIHDTTMPVFAIYYQNTSTPLTGNLAAGSNQITAAQCVAGLPAVGTRLDIPQVRMGTKVIAVSHDTITLSTSNTTGQAYADYTWINGYPKVEMYSNSSLEALCSSGNNRLLVGNSYFYQLNSPASGSNLAYTNTSMGNNYTNVYYNANTIYSGDTSKHKLKYYAITNNSAGQTIPMGSTAQRMNGNFAAAALIRINSDSASNGIKHPEIFDGNAWHQLALTADGSTTIPSNQIYVGQGTGTPNSFSNLTFNNGTSTFSAPIISATTGATVTGNLTLNGATSVFSISPTTSGYGAFTATPQASGPTILANPNSTASNSLQFGSNVKFTGSIASLAPVTGQTLELPPTGFAAGASLNVYFAANSDNTHKLALFANGSAVTQYGGFGINDNNAAGIGVSTAQGSAVVMDSRNGTAPPMRFLEHAASSSTEVEAMDIQNSGNVTIGTTTDVASAILQIASTTKGVLFPKLTTTQQNAISSPATGLLIWNIDSFAFCAYNGTAWREVAGSGGGGGVSQNLQQVLTTGSALTGNNSITNTGHDFTWINGGTGTWKWSGLLQDSNNTVGVYVSATDSSQRMLPWAKFGTKLAQYMPGFNLYAANGLTPAAGDSFYLGGTLNQNTTLGTSGFDFEITGLPSSSSGDSLASIDPATGKVRKGSIKKFLATTNGTFHNAAFSITNCTSASQATGAHTYNFGTLGQDWGVVTVTVTAANTFTQAEVTCGFTSGVFSSTTQAWGTCTATNGTTSQNVPGYITSVSGDSGVMLNFFPTATGTWTIYYNASYLINP